MCHHGMAHSRNFCSVGPLDVRASSLRAGRQLGCQLWLWLRGVRLFDVKIIVNPQGVASFWFVLGGSFVIGSSCLDSGIAYGIGFRYLRVAVALETWQAYEDLWGSGSVARRQSTLSPFPFSRSVFDRQFFPYSFFVYFHTISFA